MSFSLTLLIALASAQPPDLRLAARLDAEGRCSESEPIYQKALAQQTLAPSLLNNAGNHYLACNQPEKARTYFEQLIRAVPAHRNGNLQLARLAALRNDFPSAAAILQKLAQTAPADVEILFELGRASARGGNLPRAREALETALRLKPDALPVMVELGLASAASGDYTRAVYLLAQAHSKARNEPGIALALARAAEDAGFYGDSALAYDAYLKLKPGDDSARRDRARVLAQTTTRREEGMKEMTEYAARHPEDAIGHFNLAQFIWQSDPDASLRHLAWALERNPNLAAAHVSRAWLLHRLGRDTEALPHLEAALELTPNDARALDQLGVVQLSLGEAAKAEAALRKAAAQAPADAEIALHLGRAVMDQGRDTEAQTWLDRYQKLRPQRERDARREPGMIELATLAAPQRREREISRFRSMARARPDDPTLQMHLAALLLADGRIDEAAKEYRMLLSMNADAATWREAGRRLLDARQFALAQPFLERAADAIHLAAALLETKGPEAALRALGPNGDSPEYLLTKARILDRAGRAAEAGELLTRGLSAPSLSPALAQDAALLLIRANRDRDALALIANSQQDANTQLTAAVLTALTGNPAEAEIRLRTIEARWPEWHRPYEAHALLLTAAKRTREAAQLTRTAQALGAKPTACANLREWFLGSCR